MEFAELKAKKKTRTRHNEEDKRAIHLASLMSQLEEPYHLVVLPETGIDAEQEGTMIETISPTQRQTFNY